MPMQHSTFPTVPGMATLCDQTCHHMSQHGPATPALPASESPCEEAIAQGLPWLIPNGLHRLIAQGLPLLIAHGHSRLFALTDNQCKIKTICAGKFPFPRLTGLTMAPVLPGDLGTCAVGFFVTNVQEMSHVYPYQSAARTAKR